MSSEEKIQELRDNLLDLNEQVQVVQAKADGEKRDLLEDEEAAINDLMAKFKKTEQEIERRVNINSQTEKLMKSVGRQTEPQQPEPQNRPREEKAQSTNRPHIQVIEDRGKWGWRSFGEFAASVRPASRNGGSSAPSHARSDPAIRFFSRFRSLSEFARRAMILRCRNFYSSRRRRFCFGANGTISPQDKIVLVVFGLFGTA